MSVSEAEFKNAFRDVVSFEFSHIPQDENSISYIFSDQFNKKMEKLIRSQNKPYWTFINTKAKKIAIIFLTTLILFTATFSVKAIREPILNFIKQIFSSYTHYSYNGDVTETITRKYSITKLPEGFDQTSENETEFSIITTYENATGDCIEFSQLTTKLSTGYFVDNESGDVFIEVINGVEIEFKEWYDTKTAIWIKDGYVFSINCYGNIDFEIIKQMIKSIV